LRPEVANAVVSPRRLVEQLRLTHARLVGVRESALARDAELTLKVGHAKARLALDEEVTAALERLQERAHQRAVGVFERLLSAIVSDVLPGKGDVKFELGTERGAPALDVQIDNGGAREDALGGSGGAVANVLSAGLRFAALSRTSNRKLMVLDEPDCWLKPDRVRAFIRVIAEVSEKARTQTILISHHEPSTFEGLVNIVRLVKDERGKPTTQVMEPRSGAMWLDDDEPGLRSIRLINFRAHADTTLPLFPGVTALVGDNDLGKSTLAISALRAVAYGESDDTLIAHGATEARVEVQLERGRKIEWVRRLKGSPRILYALYENGEKTHEGRPSGRRQVPTWVSEALGISRVDELDIQLGNQKVPVFLLTEKPSTRAQLLSVGRESGRLHALIDSYADLKRKDREQVREGEAEITTLRGRLANSACLPELATKLEALAVLASDVDTFTARQAQLAQFLARVDTIERRLATFRARAKALEVIPSVPTLAETARLGHLANTIARTAPAAALRREFPAVEVPALFDQSRFARVIATIERTSKVESVRVLPQVMLPELKGTTRLAQIAEMIERTSKVANLRRSFSTPVLPVLTDNRGLVQLGQQMSRLQKRSALLAHLPALPARVEAADLGALARQIERLASRAQERTRAEQELRVATQAVAEARDRHNELIEAVGGICPVCDGELRSVSDGASHTHG
jgi:DNA repair exonuclease SbcCD ATPase subunit